MMETFSRFLFTIDKSRIGRWLFQEKHELQDIKVRDEALFQALTNGVIMFNAQKQVLLANPAAIRLTGLPREGYYLSELYKLFPSVDLEKKLDEAIKEDKIIHIEEVPLVAFFFEIFIVSVKHSQGEIIGGAIILHDITQMKKLDLAKSEFVSLASHQLRTPLSVINWYTEMLSSPDAGPLNENQKTYVMEIASASKRMVKLVNALLNISRIEFGTFMIEPEPVNLKEIAEMCVKELEPEIVKKKLKLTAIYDPSLSVILADPKLLEMICNNLLSNSVKYTSSGGQIKLTIDKGESDIMITVSDTGLGIPKEAKTHVFEKLFRADNAKEADTDGTGLGLYIVKAIVDQSGGKIRFESQEGKGTTFYVTLPLSGMQAKKGTKEIS